MSYTVRYLQEKDVKRVVDLEETYLHESLGEEMILNELNNPIVKFWVIENENEVLGYIGGYFCMDDGEILNFVIHGDYQRQGLGQQLFNEVIKYCEENHIIRLTLEVKETNEKGINFYLKNNFVQINIRKHYYKDNTNALVMMKVFNENTSN